MANAANAVLLHGGELSPVDAAAAVAADKAKAWLDLSPAWDRDRHEALQTALHAVGAALQHEPLVEAVLHADHFDRRAEVLDALPKPVIVAAANPVHATAVVAAYHAARTALIEDRALALSDLVRSTACRASRSRSRPLHGGADQVKRTDHDEPPGQRRRCWRRPQRRPATRRFHQTPMRPSRPRWTP